MAITTKEYIKRLETLAKSIEDSQHVFLAASNLIRNQTIRVFEEGGVGENGTKEIYKGGPLYINPKNAVRKVPLKGKNGGGSKFKNGNPRKTAFFKSYQAYKTEIGEPAYVNLRAFGNLFRSFGTGIRSEQSNGQTKIIHSIGINAANTQGKIDGLRAKYPAAFKATKKELDEYFEDLRNYLADTKSNIGL